MFLSTPPLLTPPRPHPLHSLQQQPSTSTDDPATTIAKLQYQVLHLTRALRAADEALDAALAPGADLEKLRAERWTARPVMDDAKQ